jgi:hypothetical protein
LKFHDGQVAGIILEAASLRQESRGAFQGGLLHQKDTQWLGHLQVHQAPGEEKVWQFEPIRKSDGSAAAGTTEPARTLVAKRG